MHMIPSPPHCVSQGPHTPLPTLHQQGFCHLLSHPPHCQPHLLQPFLSHQLQLSPCLSVLPYSEFHCWHISHRVPMGCSTRRSQRCPCPLSWEHKAVPRSIPATGCVCTQGSETQHTPSPCHQPFPSAACSPSPSSLTAVTLSSPPAPNYSCQSLEC